MSDKGREVRWWTLLVKVDGEKLTAYSARWQCHKQNQIIKFAYAYGSGFSRIPIESLARLSRLSIGMRGRTYTYGVLFTRSPTESLDSKLDSRSIRENQTPYRAELSRVPIERLARLSRLSIGTPENILPKVASIPRIRIESLDSRARLSIGTREK